MKNENEILEEKNQEIIEEKSEEKPENEMLVNDFRESKIQIPKTLALKYKIIIIVAISLVIIGIATAITLTLVKKNGSDQHQGDKSDKSDDKEEDEDIKVLTPIVIEPTSEYTHCLIFLHGYDSSPEYYEPAFRDHFFFKKKKNTKIILMRAPYQIITFNKEKKTAWFDILSVPIDSTDTYNFNEATKSRKAVEKVIRKEAKLLDGKFQNIFIGGHSQGACVTLYAGYNMEERLGGVMAFSGLLFPELEIVGDKNDLKVFLGHGYKDEAVPISFHKKTVKRIEDFDGVKKYYYKNMAHKIGKDEVHDAEGFLNKTMV